MSDLTQLFDQKGVTVVWEKRQDDLFPIRLSSTYWQNNEAGIGDWHRLRVLYSFLAIEVSLISARS